MSRILAFMVRWALRLWWLVTMPILCARRMPFWFAKEVLYRDLTEEERCVGHPKYPGIGPHLRVPIVRASVMTGQLGEIGSECLACGWQAIGTAFCWQQLDFLARRGQSDRAVDWVQGRWVPEVAATLSPTERKTPQGRLP